MSKPRRVQLSRTKGWRMPENTVSVARPGRYGNPFVSSQLASDAQAAVHMANGMHYLPDSWWQAVDVVAMFEQWMTGKPVLDPETGAPLPNGVQLPEPPSLAPLRGKSLACWCKAGAHCHADVLLRLANAEAQP